ncbi:MAG: hypothetical protein J0M12_11120 [Deltaproteobacteria bacterium]|nr:hypothetical protein [Deltaproteobacteria bacterium]
MQAIFYDFETSDKEPIGQILNYSFIHVDENFEPLAELSGDIKISRLQLPRAGAILSNRIDVLEHQKRAKDDELHAMRRILDFLCEKSRAARKPIALIGYNSAKFDLPYLRTSMIRNGLDPYAWRKGIIDRDVLLTSRKLSVSNPNFPRSPAVGGEENRLSLRMETLAQELGLLQGKQSHESREDVLLTIALAKTYRDKFGINPVTFSGYEAGHLDCEERQPRVFGVASPNYDLTSEALSIITPMTLLCASQAYTLWVDLPKFQEGRGKESIFYVKKGGHSFFLAPEQDLDAKWANVAKQAQEEFKSVNLTNYFARSTCDPEQFIYRLDFDARASLTAAIWGEERGAASAVRDRDAKMLYVRHLLRCYEWGSGKDAEIEEKLRAYALRRYGGEVVMAKSAPEPGEGGDPPNEYYHPTWRDLLTEIDTLSEQASQEDRKLLTSLREFYLNSDIYRVAGQLLEAPSKAASAA